MAAEQAVPLARRRAHVRDLVDLDRPLTARSVLATALLGARCSTMSVAALVATGSLFGISPGATRTCLWRMVSNGELTTSDGTYTLAGHLRERRERVDDASEPAGGTTHRWNGGWELAVVEPGGRSANDRFELRRAAAALHLAELREGVWARPDNLPADRVPGARATVREQCVEFRSATTDLGIDQVGRLFGLDEWKHDARRLIDAVRCESDVAASTGDAIQEILVFRFLLSVALVRHLQRDPQLPPELVPADWPSDALRSAYGSHTRQLQAAIAAGAGETIGVREHPCARASRRAR